MTARIILAEQEYRDRVYACWLGKNIGGTLGAPDETKKYTHSLTYYDPLPDKSAPNDDLDLQLVWLVMLEKEGLPPRLADFGRYWSTYLWRYPWNEYGFCSRNLARGLMPPISGWFENYYVDEMGSPIRSELWACIAPADPQTAASLAWMDSALDHAGGEGTYGEMFWAAVESAGFVLSDPLELIRIGLAMIPPACAISRVIREVVWCWQHGIRYDDARERVTRIYWNEQPCNAIPNHGYTVAGWLYGQDFGDRLCKAVNCGFDTDCTGATLGALLGILGGTGGIPRQWSDPIGAEIVLHEFTGDCGVPRSLGDLTDRTVALARRLAEINGGPTAFGAAASLPADLRTSLYRNEKAFAALAQDVRCGSAVDRDLELFLHYHGDPVLYPGIARRMSLTCRLHGVEVQPELALLEGPVGWQAEPVDVGDGLAWDVTPPAYEQAVQLKITVSVQGAAYNAAFTVLSPNEAQGYPNGVQSTVWQPGMAAVPASGKRVEISFGPRGA